MKRSLVVALSLPALSLAVACNGSGGAPPSTPAAVASPLEGVWRLTEVTTTGADPGTATDPPSVYIFGKTHYSMMRVVGSLPRAGFNAADPVPDEKIAAYDSFVGNSGTYEVAGTTLTVRPIVSKHPNFMGGGLDTYEFRIAGDTLWLNSSSTNIRFRIGEGLVSSPGPVDETVLKLVRIE